jgi:hypothetical protein
MDARLPLFLTGVLDSFPISMPGEDQRQRCGDCRSVNGFMRCKRSTPQNIYRRGLKVAVTCTGENAADTSLVVKALS